MNGEVGRFTYLVRCELVDPQRAPLIWAMEAPDPGAALEASLGRVAEMPVACRGVSVEEVVWLMGNNGDAT